MAAQSKLAGRYWTRAPQVVRKLTKAKAKAKYANNGIDHSESCIGIYEGHVYRECKYTNAGTIHLANRMEQDMWKWVSAWVCCGGSAGCDRMYASRVQALLKQYYW